MRSLITALVLLSSTALGAVGFSRDQARAIALVKASILCRTHPEIAPTTDAGKVCAKVDAEFGPNGHAPGHRPAILPSVHSDLPTDVDTIKDLLNHGTD